MLESTNDCNCRLANLTSVSSSAASSEVASSALIPFDSQKRGHACHTYSRRLCSLSSQATMKERGGGEGQGVITSTSVFGHIKLLIMYKDMRMPYKSTLVIKTLVQSHQENVPMHGHHHQHST